MNSLTTAITGHPCAWQSGDGMRWIVYEKAGGLWLVSWDGINTSVHTEIVAAGMGPAAVRMAPSNDVALFWATREGDLLVDNLQRTGTGYQMEGTPTTIVDASEGDHPPVGYASAAVQDLTGRICVFYDCWGTSLERGMYKAWLTADMVVLDRRQVCPYEVAWCSLGHNWFHNVRAVAMKPSADFLLAYMRLSYGQPKTQGLYSCVFTNNPYYVWRDPIAEWYVVRYGHGTQPPSTLEYLITADADDLYGIDRQPSGVYTVHYIHDGTRQEMTSSDGGVTWA